MLRENPLIYRKTFIYMIDKIMCMVKKRGQAQAVDAGSASLLVLVIIGAILIYVLLVPPDIREALLNDNQTGGNGNGDNGGGESILLREQPGRLDYLSNKEFEHNIPSFYLYRTINSVEFMKINGVYTRSAVFNKQGKNVTFVIQDLENTNKVIVSFQASKRVGVLTIRLNGYDIFSGEINTYNANPISLPKEFLRETNILEFSVSEVGWKFWLVNEYNLGNVRVIGEVTDISRQEARNVFHTTDSEYNNLERVWLKFLPECIPSRAGTLTVTVNYQTVFSGIPDCGILNVYEVSPEVLERGSNRVIFKTAYGNYLIDRILVKTNLKDSAELVYYFEISQEQFEDISNDDLDTNLTIEFVQEGDYKEGYVVINGRQTGLYTRKRIYTRNIDSFVQEGNNAIKIVPKSTLNIINIIIKLE